MTFEEYLKSKARTDKSTELLLKRLGDFQGRLSQRLVDLMSELEVSNGKIIQSEANIRQIGEIARALDGIWMDDELADAISDYLEEYDQIADDVFEYVKTLGAPSKSLISSIRVQFKQVLADYLTTASSFNKEVRIPIANEVSAFITSEGSYRDLVSSVQDMVKGTGESDGAVLGHARTAVNDLVSAYERTALQVSADEVGSTFFFYQGRNIDTTRPFCEERASHAWEREEVERWADLEWTGKIEGTDSRTIFGYLGGYNCRHVLVPISVRDVPGGDLARMKSLGLV